MMAIFRHPLDVIAAAAQVHPDHVKAIIALRRDGVAAGQIAEVYSNLDAVGWPDDTPPTMMDISRNIRASYQQVHAVLRGGGSTVRVSGERRDRILAEARRVRWLL